MRNRYSSQPDPEWQRETALRHVERLRKEAAEKKLAPPTDSYLANIAAGYVGVKDNQVLRWMRGEK